MNRNPSVAPSRGERWLYWGAWVIALGVVACAAYLGWRWRFAPPVPSPVLAAGQPTSLPIADQNDDQPDTGNQTVILPALQPQVIPESVSRTISLHTIIPTRPRQEVLTYTVETGDSVFALAKSFGITPETVLWANYDLLNDNPDMVTPGMELKIPPVDGVLYQWKDGDTLQGVAEAFDAKVGDIVGWSGNQMDLTNPVVKPGTLVMVPGGHREFRQWVVPTIPRGRAGVSVNLYGAGTCPGGYEGAYGTGTFVWPADNHTLSGNDYWSGHLGIDIAAGMGASVYAADSGVVVFAGGAFGGYGNMVMIDHGNGYQTLYAHLSNWFVSCGSSVSQGQRIASAGSTGNSTGAHLHFEVRYLGGFVSPWYVLPPP